MLNDKFIQAIHAQRKVRVTFYSKEDRSLLVRMCAPMDYGSSRRAKRKNDRFHLWDYESDTGEHVLSLNPEQVKDIQVLDECFNPAEFITWDTNWIVPRDWGPYS
jgi:hypothetical protein